jgi:hypothetical protein
VNTTSIWELLIRSIVLLEDTNLKCANCISNILSFTWCYCNRLICKQNDTLPTMALAEFRVNLAESLCKANQPTKRGRPSNETNATIETKWLKPTAKSRPTRDVHEDGIGHFSIWLKTRGRCKLPLCTRFSFIMCEKCDVFLCLNKARNCFNQFHN